MATRGLPAADFFADTPRPSWAAAKAAQDDLVGFVRQSIEGGTLQALTISSGTITPAVDEARYCTVDTEGAAATDDLANIDVTECPAGCLIVLRAANASRAVVLKHAAGGSGQLTITGAADLTIDTTSRVVVFRLAGTVWVEVGRFDFAPREEILVKTAPYTLSAAADHGRTITNEGAGALVIVTLPTAVAGLRFRFIVQDADGIRVVAGAADTIRVAATESVASGTAESTTIGNVLELLAINSTEWIAISYVGTWTVT